jgi:hypothetical protein
VEFCFLIQITRHEGDFRKHIAEETSGANPTLRNPKSTPSFAPSADEGNSSDGAMKELAAKADLRKSIDDTKETLRAETQALRSEI